MFNSFLFSAGVLWAVTVVTVMTVVMGYPLNLCGTVTGTAFSRSRRRREAGRKPCIKGVQRESLAHDLACKV